MRNVVRDTGIARDAGYDPKWYLFNGRFDHTYQHLDGDATVKVWLWGGSDRPASPDLPGGGPGTLYRVRMSQGDRLRIQVGGRPTKSGGGSTDGTWTEWLDGELVRGGWPDGGEGVKQELTVVWGRAYGDTGPDRTRKIPWRANGAGGATRVWLTPVGGDERLIIVEPGAGASPSPRYAAGGGAPMDEYPPTMPVPFVGAFPYDRETWSPPLFLDPDPTFEEWPPPTYGGAGHFRYQYGWCGAVSNRGVWEDNNYGEGPPYDGGGETWYPFPAPEGYTPAWFAWEQDMISGSTSVYGGSIDNPQWPVSDLGAPAGWTNDTRGEFGYRVGDNFHDEVGEGDPMPDPPAVDEEPRAPRPAVPPKALPSDTPPPSNEQRDTRFGEPGGEARGGNGEPSSFGPRCPGGGGWGGGAAGNTTRRQVADTGGGGWISWVRMGQGTGKTGGRWWNTSVVESVLGDNVQLWGVPDGTNWIFEILPPWVPSYPEAPITARPEGYDYCWPETDAFVYEVDDDAEWGRWVRPDRGVNGVYPYLHDPAYDGYVGMGAAWVCSESPSPTKRARWRVGHVGWGRNNGW